MGLPAGQRGLLGFGLLAGVGFLVTLYVIPSGPQDVSIESTVDAGERAPTPSALTGSKAGAGEFPAAAQPDGALINGRDFTETYRGYSIALPEVRGMAPDVQAGARLDLWVAWNRPITRGPRVQKLLTGAIVDELTPPLTPEGPVIVGLLIPVRELPDFLFAHRYGSLSAVAVP